MLDRLRIRQIQAQVLPPKFKPYIDPNQFKKFKPKTIGAPTIQLKTREPIRIPYRKQNKQPITIRMRQQPIIQTTQQKQSQVLRNISQKTQIPLIPKQQLPIIRQIARERAGVVLPRHRVKTVVQKRLSSVAPTHLNSIRNIGTDRILIMIAAGPSVLEIEFDTLKNHKLIDFMCINQPHPTVWPTKFWAFCDHTQYIRNADKWDTYNGIILNSTNVKARRPNQIIFRSRSGKGFSQDLIGGYHIGRSSTYAAMQVALFMNYRRIYIFGVDMSTEVNGKLHYYGQNPHVSNENRIKRFAAESENYHWAGQHLSKEIRERFIFCSSYIKWPFIKYFTNIDHKDGVKTILECLDKYDVNSQK